MTRLTRALIAILGLSLAALSGFAFWQYQTQVHFVRCWAPNNGDLFFIGPAYGPVHVNGDTIRFRSDDPGGDVMFKGVYCAITPAENEAEP